MTKLPYLRTMFATCMVFQVIYVLCVLLWFVDPNLKGHDLLPAIFPNFFYNLWPTLAAALFGQRPMNATALKR